MRDSGGQIPGTLCPQGLAPHPIHSRVAQWPNPPLPPLAPRAPWSRRAQPHQLLEGGLIQVTLESELAERLPRRLVRLHFHGAALHGALVADGAARHQGRPGQSLEALRGERRELELGHL